MSARPWLVFFIVLNLGVTAWALLHRAGAPPAAQPQDGIPVLQRAAAVAASAAPAAEPVADANAPMGAASAVPVPTARACGALGPFADAASAQAARAALQAHGLDAHARSLTSSAKGFNVFMPPQADAAAADALAARIKAAGFTDLFVMRSGALANGIALGKFGNEAAATRQQAALQAAGFPAQVMPAGAATAAFWLDVAAADAAALQSARRTAGAAQLKVARCGA